jgi:hypothetical protein
MDYIFSHGRPFFAKKVHCRYIRIGEIPIYLGWASCVPTYDGKFAQFLGWKLEDNYFSEYKNSLIIIFPGRYLKHYSEDMVNKSCFRTGPPGFWTSRSRRCPWRWLFAALFLFCSCKKWAGDVNENYTNLVHLNSLTPDGPATVKGCVQKNTLPRVNRFTMCLPPPPPKVIFHFFIIYLFWGLTLQCSTFLLLISLKFLEKLPVCEKIPHGKSYINILNSNQDIYNLKFLVFLTVHSYLIIFGDANLTVHSLVHKESKCVAISRLSLGKSL